MLKNAQKIVGLNKMCLLNVVQRMTKEGVMTGLNAKYAVGSMRVVQRF